MIENQTNSQNQDKLNEIKLIEAPENVSEENITEIVNDQVSNIEKLSKKIIEALDNAKISRAMGETAFGKNAGFGHKKEAIESLQKAVKCIGESTSDNAESQKLLFDCLQKMAQVEKTILSVSCMSIATNRSAIEQLETILEGASKEKFSELTRRELHSIIKQIRQQQDILEKQDRLEENVRTLHKEIEEIKTASSKTKIISIIAIIISSLALVSTIVSTVLRFVM